MRHGCQKLRFRAVAAFRVLARRGELFFVLFLLLLCPFPTIPKLAEDEEESESESESEPELDDPEPEEESELLEDPEFEESESESDREWEESELELDPLLDLDFLSFRQAFL